jgi:AMP phosphorylase
MMLKAKKMEIETGELNIVILNSADAVKMDLFYSDRVSLKKGSKEIIATVDITSSPRVVKKGQIGIFHETSRKLKIKNMDRLSVMIAPKPKSIANIRKKLTGFRLSYKEIREIVDDIIQDRLTGTEMAYFVAANFMNSLTTTEIIHMTNAMVAAGERLKIRDKRIVVDKHCIGGVAGNRTTMLVVPIIAAAGYTIPKTSSRAITSAAGTSDTVEVLCDVSFPLNEMRRIVKKTGACLIWGGATNLAPADDKIIRVEMPLSVDPMGQMLASILAKKLSVSATHCLIDIPRGKGCKTESKKKAMMLKRAFSRVSRKLGLKTKVIITDGSEPIGNGIGPALEAKDVMYTLRNDMDNGSIMLKEKSIILAGHIFDLIGKTRLGRGKYLAREIIESGRAYEKFMEIIRAQNAKVKSAEDIKVARYSSYFRSKNKGKVVHLDNRYLNKAARIAGAPADKRAGIYLYVHKGYNVEKGIPILRVHSDSRQRLKEAMRFLHENPFLEIVKPQS